MRVDFADTPLNWQLWGKLVELWTSGLQPQPKVVKELEEQGKALGITGFSVPGMQPDLPVAFHWEQATQLDIWLPSEDMLKKIRAELKAGSYPLPSFYDEAYSGKRADLTLDRVLSFETDRLGEYVINNCA